MVNHLSPFIPPLPGGANAWEEDIVSGHSELVRWYNTALSALDDEGNDPLRLRSLAKEVDKRCRPLCLGISACGLPEVWMDACIDCIAGVLVELETVARAIESDQPSKVHILQTITVHQTGKRGRPPKQISKVALTHIIKTCPSISNTKLGKIFQVSRHTIRSYREQYGLQKERTTITDEELDNHLRNFKLHHPNSGAQFLLAYLRDKGIRASWTRIRASRKCVDPVTPALRKAKKIKHRNYKSPHSDTVWHMDGHHKLIMYGWVIHGIIDGYDRSIRSLQATTDNRVETVLELFLGAVQRNRAPPQCVRGDHGGENVKVAAWMMKKRGKNRGSYLFGTSQHNQRIERFWVDLGAQCVRAWRAFFVRLEELYQLNRHKPHHLWLLHLLFTLELNKSIDTFREHWNHHPMKGRDTHHKSPNEMRTISQYENGVYVEEEDKAHGHDPQYFIQKHLCTPDHATQALPGPIVPDHLIRAALNKTNHRPVKTPHSQNPFPNDAIADQFLDSLATHLEQGRVPRQYGARPSEWVNLPGRKYPSAGSITVGTQKQTYEMRMPVEV